MFGRYYRPVFEKWVPSEWIGINLKAGKLKPLLLNSGDGMQIAIYTSIISPSKNLDDAAFLAMESPTEFVWTCRIVNVSCPEEVEYILQPTESNPFLTVWIQHQGWELYFLVFALVILFAITLWLGLQSSRLQMLGRRHFLIIIVSMVLSVSTAEIIVDWIFQGRNIMNQSPLAVLIVLAYIIWIFYLFLPLLLRKIVRDFVKVENTE
jgi:hypothetical protein